MQQISFIISNVLQAAGPNIAIILQAGTIMVAAVIIAFAYSWKLTLVVIAFGPLTAIATLWQQRVFINQAGRNQKNLEEAGKVAFEAISNIRTVTMLGLQEMFFVAFQDKAKLSLRNEIIKAHTYGESTKIPNNSFLEKLFLWIFQFFKLKNEKTEIRK